MVFWSWQMRFLPTRNTWIITCLFELLFYIATQCWRRGYIRAASEEEWMEKMCAHLPGTVQAEKSCGVLTYLCLALQLRASPTLGSHVSKP